MRQAAGETTEVVTAKAASQGAWGYRGVERAEAFTDNRSFPGAVHNTATYTHMDVDSTNAYQFQHNQQLNVGIQYTDPALVADAQRAVDAAAAERLLTQRDAQHNAQMLELERATLVAQVQSQAQTYAAQLQRDAQAAQSATTTAAAEAIRQHKYVADTHAAETATLRDQMESGNQELQSYQKP